MNLWQKMVVGTKFLTGGFEPAADYLVGLVNEKLEGSQTQERLVKFAKFAKSAVSWLEKLARYCPLEWRDEYDELVESMRVLAEALEDGKLESGELVAITTSFRRAYETWRS